VSGLHKAVEPFPGAADRIGRRGTSHGSGLGTVRWAVERTFAWLHAHKRLAIRWEYRADIHQALVTLACRLICWRYLDSSS
jgi:transposase